MKETMTIVSSLWNDAKSFRLIPVTNDCPYVEGIFDVDLQVLVIISKNKKQSYHMLPKLDDNGDALKSRSKRANGKDVKEERRMVDSFQEYYIIEHDDIIDFIEKCADNTSKFDYKQFIKK
jgi:hypothetical protein